MKTKEEILNQRSRIWSITTYNEPKEFIPYLTNKTVIGAFYILHDKDENEPHYHVCLRGRNPIKLQTIVNKFGKQNTFGEKTISITAYKTYIQHANEEAQKEGKHLYNETDIKYIGENIIEYEEKEECENIILDIMQGIRMKDLLNNYGNKLIWHWNQYLEFARQMQMQECGITLPYEQWKDEYTNTIFEKQKINEFLENTRKLQQTKIEKEELFAKEEKNEEKGD